MGRASEFINFLNSKNPKMNEYSSLTITKELRMFKSELVAKNRQKGVIPKKLQKGVDRNNGSSYSISVGDTF